jgi:hypothetical protein
MSSVVAAPRSRPSPSSAPLDDPAGKAPVVARARADNLVAAGCSLAELENSTVRAVGGLSPGCPQPTRVFAELSHLLFVVIEHRPPARMMFVVVEQRPRVSVRHSHSGHFF